MPAPPTPAATAALKPITQASLQMLLTATARKLLIPGPVIFLRTPQGALTAIYGTMQSDTLGRPNAETYFRIASNTKTMTAAVIVQLNVDGKIVGWTSLRSNGSTPPFFVASARDRYGNTYVPAYSTSTLYRFARNGSMSSYPSYEYLRTGSDSGSWNDPGRIATGSDGTIDFLDRIGAHNGSKFAGGLVKVDPASW